MNNFVAVCVLVGILAPITLSSDLSNGWNDKINWLTIDDALAESENTNSPVMLIIHKSWCGACKALMPKFGSSLKIEELSSYFHMVNTLDAEEPKDPMYSPDGAYIPRILFIREGKVEKGLIHKDGNAKYKHYYHSPDGIIKTMEEAIQTFGLRPLVNTADDVGSVDDIHTADHVRIVDDVHTADNVHIADDIHTAEHAHIVDDIHTADHVRIVDDVHAADDVHIADDVHTIDEL